MITTRAVRLRALGGPEELHWEEVELPAPGPGEVVIRHTAVGLNFIDTYHRTGLYPVGDLPTVLGKEAAGVVEEVGSGVRQVRRGDRVAYLGPLGAYSDRRVIEAEQLVPLPPEVTAEAAAATLLKGLTTHLLLERFGRVESGSTILVQAAAGGVGLILCQWARALGARVIGTVGSEAKAVLAAAHGCDHPILYRHESFPDKVLALTEGEGVPVVFDGVGQATFDGSLRCLAPFGRLIVFGNASGPVPPIDVLRLTPRCLTVARPSVATGLRSREDLLAGARGLFERMRSGNLRPVVGQRFPLREAAAAHRALEARETLGSTILVPEGAGEELVEAAPEGDPGELAQQPVGAVLERPNPMNPPARSPILGRWVSSNRWTR